CVGGAKVDEPTGAHHGVQPPPQKQVLRNLGVVVQRQHAGQVPARDQGIAGDVGQASLAGKILIVAAEGGEHDVFNAGLVVRQFADGSGASFRVVAPPDHFLSSGVGQVARTG